MWPVVTSDIADNHQSLLVAFIYLRPTVVVALGPGKIGTDITHSLGRHGRRMSCLALLA